MRVQDGGGIIDVLDGVLCLGFFEDVGRGHALRLGHELRFDELVVGGSAGHDDARGDAGAVLADAFKDALALLRRGSSVGAGRCSEDDDGVEVSGRGVVCGQGSVAAV